MKSFIARRVRNVAVLKIGIPIAITLGSFFLIAMIVSAIIAAIISPIETVKNVVADFFTGQESTEDSDIDLRACLAIDPAALNEVLSTVPPRTDIESARAWLTLRAQEIVEGTEPAYDSIITYLASPAAQNAIGRGNDSAGDPTRYDLAATAGVIALVEREIVVGADDDTVPDLSATLAEHCSA
ncbi:hypothetical protein GS896_25365 [Rhodococcus hoagii]|nr:hypothetical protein [Prescottella equi]MBM4574692.1 hypothetical protein [Prescottella equi]MBM4574904.1 hypothetical protein [Prescottella equi]MBM4654166.1 hypothetical protein [Prescottella equi]MBM4719638.1 hypothetical protein [Prescottella equi]